MQVPGIGIPLALAASLFLGACRSAEQSQAAGASLAGNADLVERGMHELDAVVAALHDLVDAPAADLAGQRRAFEEALEGVETTAEEVAQTSARMSAGGQAFLRGWDEELAAIQGEDLGARSADRRRAVEAGFADLQGGYGEALSAFEPLLDQLRDIRAALRSDLTLEGLDALKPAVKHVDKQAAALREELQSLAEGFRELGVAGPAGPAGG